VYASVCVALCMCVKVLCNRVCVCARDCVGLCACIYTSRCVCYAYMYVYNVYVSVVYQCVCLVTCHSDMDPLARSGPVTGGPDTQVIQRPKYGTILRSILVRTVKTRRRFSFKIASFHVSVCSYIIFLFTAVSRHICVTCIISCSYLIYFTSMITSITS